MVFAPKALALPLALAVLTVGPRAGGNPAPALGPRLPGAVADPSGAAAVVAEPDGDVAAVDLATGATRWRSADGRWPLAAAGDWVGVVAPDRSDPRALRVRFLRLADGRRLVEARPIRLPVPVAGHPSWEGDVLALRAPAATIRLSAWLPRAGRLRLRWRVESGEHRAIASGLAFIDVASGAVQLARDDAAESPEPRPPTLPPSWKPAPGTIYWTWSWYAAAWSERPRLFWIGDSGVAGFLALEAAGRRLVLERVRDGARLPPVELASGADLTPAVSEDGRFVLVSAGDGAAQAFTLRDLDRLDAAPVRIPRVEPAFRPPFAVVGRALYFVSFGPETPVTGGAEFPRALISVDLAAGKVRWRRPLPPFVQPAPPEVRGSSRPSPP
jgi:hypothetical protein